MEVIFGLAAAAIFLSQLVIAAVVVQKIRYRTRMISENKPLKPYKNAVSEFYDGNRFFFEKTEKVPPLYRFYGEIKQFKMDVFSSEAFLCGLDELSDLLDEIDPAMGAFFLVITDERKHKTLQFQCDLPNRIEVIVSDNEHMRAAYQGILVFASDMKHFMMDYFEDMDVISRYSLKLSVMQDGF